ncbi:M56 family metallopeptidase [Alistipes timonensis]|uniref:M56 family metallopeptidase n=1 Tax=Alistipes timonensis TaxID=1465754 RepID=UPI001C3C2CE9|nr:M56 family metallopeptidase [Alistipes timonensis]MCR2030579.1 TonB-dependent receptor plug domain-containing protein [Alistipes timonensis]
MYDLMIYSLKVGGCLAVFYLFFKLLLSRETFHRFNRIVLLGAMVLSFVLPLCVITVYRELPVLPESPAEEAVTTVAAEPPAELFPWEKLAGGVFVAGAVVTLLGTCCSLFGVVRLVRRGSRERLEDGSVLVRTDRAVTPFSWGRYIVMSGKDLAENGDAILLHERAHLRLRHSLDLIVTDVAGCLQWFNPAMWLLRRELRAIHEYEADEAVLESGVDAKDYQLLLIRKAAGGRWYSVANSFNHSKLKNRITMMLRKRSSRWAGARVLLLLPLMGAALGAFAETAYVFPEDKVTKEKPGIRIRGVKSSSGKEPLVLVDGRRTDRMDTLESERIESITVLKDSTATAVYGEKGRNGVILVEMKKDTEPASMYLEVKKAKVVSGKSGTVIVSDSVGTVVTAGQPEEVTVVGYGMKSKEGNVVRLRGHRRSDSRTVVYLVDGVRVPEIESLDPNRIESISVLKDASVPAEYLAEGCTGVIAITTKRTPDARQAAVESVEGSPDSSTTVYKGSVTVNGAFSEGTLILINGKEAAQADVDALKPGRIKKMTVYKGDEAVKRYGERRRNGVADIRVRK